MDLAQLVEALAFARTPAFRRRATAPGGPVEWIDIPADGAGEGVLLLLHGGLGSGEDFFPFFPALRRRWRLLAPSLPAHAASVRTAVEAITAALDGAGAGAAHVFGHSQGGYLAQAMVRLRPDRVRSAVFSSTCPPSRAHARRIAPPGLLSLAPEGLVRAAAGAALDRAAAPFLAEVGPGLAGFWSDQLRAALARPGLKARALAAARLQRDFHSGVPSPPGAAPAWRGRASIFWAEQDSLMGADDLADLMRAYPHAEVTRFAGAGHLSLMARVEVYAAAIDHALAGRAAG